MIAKAPDKLESFPSNKKHGSENKTKVCIKHLIRNSLPLYTLFPKVAPLHTGICLLLAIALVSVISSCGSDDSEPYRSIDGSGNNLRYIEMNQAGVQLIRLVTPDYTDGISSLAGSNRPNPRDISNMVNVQEGSVPNQKSASDFLWLWGQFLDHDISLTPKAEPLEMANIPIPPGDPFFDPDSTGAREMTFSRSVYDPDTGTSMDNPRQQLNEITGWIDASNIYGSTEERAAALRLNDGSGKLRTSDGNLLAFNHFGLPNDGGTGPELFISGDVRANEHVGLTAMHTLFVREHNRLAEEIAMNNPSPSGEEIYQRARRIVGAQMQAITYNEFLPVLLGPDAIESSSPRYDSSIDAGVKNIFSTAAYRFGHSMLSSLILRLDEQGNEIEAGHLQLREAFFSPQKLIGTGLEPILRGFAAQVCQKIDVFFVDEVRNFLFGNPGAGGFDLAALNIQRGRDHGLPSYNEVRRELQGLEPKRNFSEVTESPEVQNKLTRVYSGDIENMGFFIGGLAEDSVPGSMLGELFHTIVTLQFKALRDGDRFWYERTLSREELKKVKETRLADIIRRNTNIGDEISDNVFIVEQSN